MGWNFATKIKWKGEWNSWKWSNNNGVIKYLFEYATGYNSKVNAYAITECEFTEILPEIKRGIYLLYTEKEAIL